MSTALAIAGVTAVMRGLLNNGLIESSAANMLGSSATSVSVGPPDRVLPTDGTEASQLNLYLYQVTPNSGWRNEGLPSSDGAGRQRLSNAPLALNLHYLLSAYGAQDLHREILLGYAMQILHESPVLTRTAIAKTLMPSSDSTPLQRLLAESGLERQIELIKLTPEYLNTEETSKLWTAAQTHLRPSAAYMASVVLIEANRPVRSPLPVLSRGGIDPISDRERGVVVQPGMLPPLPTLEALVPAGGQPVAQMDTAIELRGHHLDAAPGTSRSVRVRNDRFSINESLLAADPANAAGAIAFTLPSAQAATFPVGVYSVSAQLTPLNETADRETNRLAMTLAPTLIGLPMNVARDDFGGATFVIQFFPQLRAGQQAVLILGQEEFAPETYTAPVSELQFVVPNAPVGSHLARLRIDGVESPLIDRSVTPPVFLNQRINIV